MDIIVITQLLLLISALILILQLIHIIKQERALQHYRQAEQEWARHNSTLSRVLRTYTNPNIDFIRTPSESKEATHE